VEGGGRGVFEGDPDVSNGWLARQLDMGSHFFVSKHVEAAGRGLALGLG